MFVWQVTTIISQKYLLALPTISPAQVAFIDAIKTANTPAGMRIDASSVQEIYI
jgi:hypothetical protein